MRTRPAGLASIFLGRPLRLALFAVCLAFGLNVAFEPKGLEPRRPWIAAESGLPEGLPVELEQLAVSDPELAGDVAWIRFSEAQAFVEFTLEGLTELADRINTLRRLAIETRSTSGEQRSDQALEFEVQFAQLEEWAAELEFESLRPLNSMRPIVVESDGQDRRAVKLELPRWNREAFGLEPLPFESQSESEQTLSALDRGYYRVVAAYREVAKLEAWLLANQQTQQP